MESFQTTEIEKTNLEAHVGMCALRFSQLNDRLRSVESKVDEIHQAVSRNNNSLIRAIIGAAATISAGAFSVALAIYLQ
jgi:SMC interacting uncharacterized protein involved in chromosome segregation